MNANTHTRTHKVLIYSWVWSCRGWQDHCWLDWNAADACCSPHLTNKHTTHTHTQQRLWGAHSHWLDLQLFFFRCQSIHERCTWVFVSPPPLTAQHSTAQCVFMWHYGNFHYGDFTKDEANDGAQGEGPHCVRNNVPLRPWTLFTSCSVNVQSSWLKTKKK